MMVKRKIYFRNPISRQNFANAFAETPNLNLEVRHKDFPHIRRKNMSKAEVAPTNFAQLQVMWCKYKDITFLLVFHLVTIGHGGKTW